MYTALSKQTCMARQGGENEDHNQDWRTTWGKIEQHLEGRMCLRVLFSFLIIPKDLSLIPRPPASPLSFPHPLFSLPVHAHPLGKNLNKLHKYCWVSTNFIKGLPRWVGGGLTIILGLSELDLTVLDLRWVIVRHYDSNYVQMAEDVPVQSTHLDHEGRPVKPKLSTRHLTWVHAGFCGLSWWQCRSSQMDWERDRPRWDQRYGPCLPWGRHCSRHTPVTTSQVLDAQFQHVVVCLVKISVKPCCANNILF